MFSCFFQFFNFGFSIVYYKLRHCNFLDILSRAYKKKKPVENFARLQWDPMHYPGGDKVQGVRAIQLGLKLIPSFTSGDGN